MGPLRIRLVQEELSLIDLVRGEMPRATWIQHAIAESLERWSGMPELVGLSPSRDGAWVAIPFRLSTEAVAAVDEARGLHPRDVWLREVAVRFTAGVQAGDWKATRSRRSSKGVAA